MAEIGIFPYKNPISAIKKFFPPYFFLIKKIPKIVKKTCVRHVRILNFTIKIFFAQNRSTALNMALNELKMGAFSFSRRAVFKNVSKRQNPIFLRISTAKTRFSKNVAISKIGGGQSASLLKYGGK